MPCVPGAAAFWAKVNKLGPLRPGMKTRCWVWTAFTNKKGYGTLKVGGRRGTLWLAHRFARFLATGRMPALCVLHRCDNPACVRNSHLFDGSKADNNEDCRTKGRFRYVLPDTRGEKHGSVKLTDSDVRKLRSLYATGEHSQRKLASMFQCNQSQVSKILTGKLRGNA